MDHQLLSERLSEARDRVRPKRICRFLGATVTSILRSNFADRYQSSSTGAYPRTPRAPPEPDPGTPAILSDELDSAGLKGPTDDIHYRRTSLSAASFELAYIRHSNLRGGCKLPL
jgi:hypothetical protein